jgi:hypothetical protein
MKKIGVLGLSFILSASIALGATNTYQVTGPILELKPDSITVQKGKERWEIARDAATRISGELKVGTKVTIEYRMFAVSVTVKPADNPAPAKKK